MKMKICYLFWFLISCNNCQEENSEIVKLLGRIPPEVFYRTVETYIGLLDKVNHVTKSRNNPAKMKKIQTPISDDVPFPCDVSYGRSPERPTSVHALRPGDIDVIGGMGDSLTAGFGAFATSFANMYLNNRGIAWTIGGQGTWRQYLTIPNILKEFNKNLVGYSLGDSTAWQKASQFNVAGNVGIVGDMPYQAKILRKRMTTDSRVNFEEDWKLITIFIGANNFCSFMCYEDEKEFMDAHRRDMMETLDFLHDNYPRTLVNLMPAPNLKILMGFNARPAECVPIHIVECPCLFASSYVHRRANYIEMMDQWQKVDIEIGNMDRYKDKPDFAIVVQPFSTDPHFPTRRSASGNNVTDYSYLSADCFHFSQKTNSIAANALWNNMMEPVGNKSLGWEVNLMSRFMCPTEQHPFIFTTENSLR